MSNKEYKLCECNGPTCCGGRGPAVWSVVRDGKQMNICTRCDLSTDTDRKLIIDDTYDADTLRKFDALGFMSVLFELEELKKADRTTLPTAETETPE